MIALPILCYTHKGIEMSDSGMDVPDEETYFKTIYFNQIDYVAEHDDDKSRAYISVGGEGFTCKFHVKVVVQMIALSKLKVLLN
jgi:hypothetical protein